MKDPDPFTDLPDFSAPSLKRSRDQVLEKIGSVPTDREISIRYVLQELQYIRQSCEDSLSLHHEKSEQSGVKETLKELETKSLECLNRIATFQVSLFESAMEDSLFVEPNKMVKQELLESETTDMNMYFDGSGENLKNGGDYKDLWPKDSSNVKDENFTLEDYFDEDVKDFPPVDIKVESDEIEQKPPKKRRRRKKGEPIMCEKCNKMFDIKCKYLEHMRRHTGEKPYKCEECSRAFFTKGNLKIHVSGCHRKERNFQCHLCAKSCKNKADLERHVRVHTGEKPYRCEFCNMAFTTSGNLIRHRRTHTGEKPFPCEVCNKAFADRGSMVAHVRIHTGEKPFQCYLCSRAFASNKHLKRHLIVHSGIKPYQCEVCEKAFARREGLKEHMNTHNRIKSE